MAQLDSSDKPSSLLSQNLDTLSIVTSERIKLLQREINMVRELLELEPDSKCLYKFTYLRIAPGGKCWLFGTINKLFGFQKKILHSIYIIH